MDAYTPALQRLVDRVTSARSDKAAVDIRGGGSKSFYANEPRGVPLDTRQLTGITSYEPTELVVTTLAGTPVAELEAVLAERGQCLPFEPPRFGAGTVGGMVAAGLSGPARPSAGPVRDFVLGVSMLTGAGEVLTFGGQVMKNVAGYDVSRVVAGSWGILGVICEVSLKVTPTPPAFRTLCMEVDEAGGLAQCNRWAGQAFPLHASSWYRGQLYVRLAGAPSVVSGVPVPVGGRELAPEEADSWWSGLRDQRHAFFAFTQSQLDDGECLWRLAIPDTAPPVSLSGEQLIEWGGGQRWWRTKSPAAQVRAAAAAASGHATLVRALDKSPGAFTAPPPASMRIQERLKQAFDPAGIFNPGRLYAGL